MAVAQEPPIKALAVKAGQEGRRETAFFCVLYRETGIAVTGGNFREQFTAVCMVTNRVLRGDWESLPKDSNYLGFIFSRRARLRVAVMPLWHGVSV